MIDARGAEGVQIGNQGTQINYFYNGTWTSGVAAAPLVSVSGTIAYPYRGLGAFEERDAGLFFGRETAVAEVLEVMSRRLDGPGLVVVSGVSGAGKSSLIRAGVLHRLRGIGLGSAPEASSWPCLVFRPGRAPLDELAARIAPLASADAPAVRRGLAADPAGFALTARAAALAGASGSGQQRVLLLVDQCEELFTLCQSEQERQAFLTALHAAGSTGHGPSERPAALVVLVIRADFEARLADYPPVIAAIQARYLVTAMTSRELQLAITQPAIAAGSSVDADLVQVMLQDVVASARPQPGATGGAVGAGVLPLLSHTLDQAWRGRAGQAVTLADYVRTGGVEGAIARSAESAYSLLTPAQQIAARQVFTRLTGTSSDGTDTAVRATRSDLSAGADAAQARDVGAVLEAFAAERLLTLAADTAEISHEALLTAWPRLRDSWLAETHADRVVLTGLRETAADWIRARRDPSFLYAGSRLEAAADVGARIGTDRRHAPLGPVEEAFLHASRRAARRRFLRVRAVIASLVILVAGLAAISVAATRADQEAVSARQATGRQLDIALSGQLASQAIADPNGSAARIQAIAAYSLNRSAEAYNAMLDTAASAQFASLTTGNAGFDSLTFSPDGKTLATVGADGTAELWNLTTRRLTSRPFVGSSNPYTSSGSAAGAEAFSPDDQTLAEINQASTVQLWNTATRKPVGRPFAGADGGAAAVTFSPDGKTLAAVGGNGTVQLWDVATRRPVGRPFAGGNWMAASAMFSPDGKILATSGGTGPGSDVAVRLWDVATGQPIGNTFAGGSEPALSMAFGPDSTTLVTMSDTNDYSGPLQLWNVHTRQPIGPAFAGGYGGVFTMVFSPDGKTLATVNGDGTVRLWDTATRKQVGGPIPSGSDADADTFSSLAFSPDGSTLAIGNPDGTIGLWNVAQAASLPIGQVGQPFSGGHGGVNSVVFSPDGKTLATVSDDGLVQLWDAATRQPIGRPIADGNLDIAEAAFSPDGKILATTDQSLGGIVLWNTATHQPIGQPLGSLTTTTWSLAFSPNGKILATSNGVVGGRTPITVRLWNVATGQPIGHTFGGGDGGITSVTFDPNGTMLATVGQLGQVQIWNVASHEPIGKPFAAGSGGTLSAQFDPDGTTLATLGQDGQLRLWDVATRQPIGNPIASGTSAITSMAFSPDSQILATGDYDGTLRLWDTATGQQIGDPLASGNSDGSSLAFSPDGQMLATVGFATAAQIWNVGFLVRVLARLCHQVGGSLTRTEWSQYVGPGPAYRNICPSS